MKVPQSTLARVGAISAFVLVAWLPTQAAGVSIGFEGFAPPGSSVNVPTASPYMEAGFTLTPTNNLSAVFDSTSPFTMSGNTTDWFGFNELNMPSLTRTGGGTFDITSVLIGPSSAASSPPISMTIEGFLSGGGSITSMFSGLNTATTANLNWTNLVSVKFTASDDSGLDDIVVTATAAIPEPSTIVLMGLGLVALGYAGRRKLVG